MSPFSVIKCGRTTKSQKPAQIISCLLHKRTVQKNKIFLELKAWIEKLELKRCASNKYECLCPVFAVSYVLSNTGARNIQPSLM